MNVLDWIILAVLVAGIVYGIFKGFIKLLFSALGVFVVSVGAATLSPYVQNWFSGVESMTVYTRSAVAMVLSAVVIFVVYLLITWVICKLISKNKKLNAVNRIIGALIGVVSVYMLFAVIIALMVETDPEFMASVKTKFGDVFTNSWFSTHIYKNNFFGNWIVKDLFLGILNKILEGINPNALMTLI